MYSLLSCLLSVSILFSGFIQVVFHCWMIFYCMDIPCLICPFIISWGLWLGSFPFFGCYKECCCERSCTDFWVDVCSRFLGYDRGVEILGYMVALFNFLFVCLFNIFEAVLTGFPKWLDHFSLPPAQYKASIIFSVLLVIIVPLVRETVRTSIYSNYAWAPNSILWIFMSTL